MDETILFLGAGATKSVQGPMTDEILPRMYADKALLASADPKGLVARLVQFLETEFHVHAGLSKEQYPGLPLLMSLLDMALDRREIFSAQWDVTVLAELRQAIELGIFDVLEEALMKFPTNNHYSLLDRLFPLPKTPRVITTNYDLVVDTSMMNLSRKWRPVGGLPNYHCGIANQAPVGPDQRFGSLLKLHGSLNWLYCRTCQRMELGATDSTRFLSIYGQIMGPDLRSSFTADGEECRICRTQLRPLLVAPSHLKDYRNPHLAQVWYEAQHMLRESSRAVFIGYSLPDDDVEVIYLLKRGLSHITDPKKITVVEYCAGNPLIPLQDHPVGRRYRALFGDVDWFPGGLDAWLASAPGPLAAGSGPVG